MDYYMCNKSFIREQITWVNIPAIYNQFTSKYFRVYQSIDCRLERQWLKNTVPRMKAKNVSLICPGAPQIQIGEINSGSTRSSVPIIILIWAEKFNCEWVAFSVNQSVRDPGKNRTSSCITISVELLQKARLILVVHIEKLNIGTN